MRIPTLDDWKSEPWGIDSPHAYKHFFQKNAEEAKQLFVQHVELYYEDLLHLPKACFPYYFEAFLGYLERGDVAGDFQASGYLGCIVKARRQCILVLPEKTRSRLRSILIQMRDAEKVAYGTSATRADDFLRLLEKEPNQPSQPMPLKRHD